MKIVFIVALTAACSTETSIGNTDPAANGRVQVALLPQETLQNLDVLFVVDDSPGMLAKQAALVQAFPSFVQVLDTLPTGRPSMHIGVVSTDLGTKGAFDPAAGPQVGNGPGSCAGLGKNGVMAGSLMLSDPYIADLDAGNGTRATNYTGSLADAFSSIASLGSSGCAFEQPLQAAQLALVQPENAGFMRDGAPLAVIVLTDEDDCSLARSALLGTDVATLGPLMSFRCTRFGVTCDQGGTTTDDMNTVGPKSRCHANESLAYLTSAADTAAAIQAVKPDPRNVLFAALAGTVPGLEVEMRIPGGGGIAIPALKHTCSWASSVGEEVIDPAVRIKDHASAYPRSRVESACQGDVAAPLFGIAREIRSMLGDPCLTRDIALPSDCVAYNTFSDGSVQQLQQCSSSTMSDCYHLVADPGCPGQGQRLVTRLSVASPDAMVSLRCKL